MSIQAVFAENRNVMRAATMLSSLLQDVTAVLQDCLASKNKILVCGNGGSAATAQHFVAELVCRFRDDRPALAAIALSADSMTLTAVGNDYGYTQIFARQVEALGVPGDVLVALSTSGQSPNVIEAVKAARSKHCKVIALTGMDGGALAPLADVSVRAPSQVVARIQEVHDVCIHAIAEALEENARGAGRQ